MGPRSIMEADRDKVAPICQVHPLVRVMRGFPFRRPRLLFEPKYGGFRELRYVSPRQC
jgi:hypothetical protein